MQGSSRGRHPLSLATWRSAGTSFGHANPTILKAFISAPLRTRRHCTQAPSENAVQSDAPKAKKGGRPRRSKADMLSQLQRIVSQLSIQQPEDWYSVSMSDLRELGLPLVNRNHLVELLGTLYPDHKWETTWLLRGRYAQQKRLENALRALFPEQEIEVNTRKVLQITLPSGDVSHLELDFFLPALNLAFEHQEEHHYTSSDRSHTPLELIQERDRLKKEAAAAKGLTLLHIPAWWDGRPESLVATIRQARPELLTNASITENATPISEQAPYGYLEKHIDTIEDIGQPTTACFFTRFKENPATWWLFEKYDGVRGFWNPLKKAFYSRKGNKFVMPQEVIDAMPPDVFLDGELWFGRQNFQEAMKLVHRMDAKNIDWKNFKYMVFDIPNHTGTYSERYNDLCKLFNEHPCKYIQVAAKEECIDTTHLEVFFQDVIDRGGEGIILRDPLQHLTPGRSPGFLKHKKFRDAEARIVGTTGPGLWECELPHGIRFTASAATTEFVKRWEPRPGDIVSFKHNGFLFGSKRPKFPSLYRLRPDLAWDEVVKNWNEKTRKPSITEWPWRKGHTKSKPAGYWIDKEKRREFFLALAQGLGFDPWKQPDRWANVTLRNIYAHNGRGIIERYKTLENALVDSFPEMADTFKDLSWKRNNAGYWSQKENQRNLLFDYAQEMGFEPLDQSSWRGVSVVKLNQFINKKGRGQLPRLSSLRPLLESLHTGFH